MGAWRGGVGWGGKHERSRQEKGVRGGWVRRQTQFGVGVVVVVVEGVSHLLIVVFEWTSGDWYARLCVCVCMCACMHACACSYCLLGDNGRLQYLRFCSLKCILMWFLS